ncbi:endo-1,4-beta-xylanase (glycosyl hydrolase family 10) [Nocardiopsis sp. Huas11]|uniref:endo-1,4-beta-xylanase n=1 Tax=Nocardiopsis sp. Huas11 TaxID=2183912 RepID=UPI000EAE9E09|nr:endo-1,4-beta-xylanase [Nocardiopsis sp. Huas11]RKS08370.1 endo-1,4-beta-xylanase (glycosyl hydrolase family 10) [Nocardiopsis sp. Huas11]
MPGRTRTRARALAAVALGCALAAGTATAAHAAPAAPTETAAETERAQQSGLREPADELGLRMGTAVSAHLLDQQVYRDTAATEFNFITHENSLKWESVQPQRGQYSFADADRIMEFAQANDQEVHGHTLVWHSQLPSWVEDGNFSEAELTEVTTDHIETTMGRYAGEIATWDVVNEPFNEDGTFRDSVFQRTLGEDYIAQALTTADSVDPDARLFVNDYNIEGINAKSDGMYALAESLLDQGVPLDGVGIQGHLVVGQVPGDVRQNIERFTDLGLEVVITELDIRMDLPVTEAKLERQAADYALVMDACLSVPGCSGVSVWGVTDAHSWVPDVFEGQGAALPIDEAYAPKPAYWAISGALGGATGPGTGDPDEPGEPGEQDCLVTYAVTSHWGQGAVVDVTVRNDTGEPVPDWSLTWTQPAGERITGAWNAQVVQSGSEATATPVAWNGTIAPGGSVTFGMQIEHGGEAASPAAFALEGQTCRTG